VNRTFLKRFSGWLLPALVALFLAYGFYYDAKDATITATSSDQWNILPICIKLDHPGLYEGDLFAENTRDVKYYTPFFVNSIRFLTVYSEGNYIEGLNKLNFLINFAFSILWYWFFFRLFKNMSLALLMSLIVRGVLWMPGFELWGAGALWTALPRTAFIALLPIPLVLFSPLTRRPGFRYVGSLVCGIISNFHPISGLGIGVGLLVSNLLYDILDKKGLQRSIMVTCGCGLLFGIGLLPFVHTYWKYVLGVKATDPELFNALIPLRIGEQFQNPLIAVRKFGQWRWIAMIWGPVLGILAIVRRLPEEKRRHVWFYGIFLVVVLAFALLVVPAEVMMRNFGMDLHMAFQLVRNVKYLIVSVYVFVSILLWYAVSRLKETRQKAVSYLLLGLFILAMLLSRFAPFNRMPLIGDDCVRSTLPNLYSLKKENLFEDVELDSMFDWINASVDPSATFIGPARLRAACRRSVVFDGKGASMVIEGNPDRFVQWGQRALALKVCSNWDEKIEHYRCWDAEYMLVKETTECGELLYSRGEWQLYDLRQGCVE